MAKKVMGEDGKMYKVQKPFYKKIWFWILVVIVLAGVGGALSGDDSEASNGGTKVENNKTDVSESSETAQESTEETQSIDFYQVGDTVQVGDAEYTLTSVELTDERNQFDDTNPAQVVKVSYTIKNNGDSDLPVGMDVEVYGSDDKKSESYPNENTMGSVAPGKQMDCEAHFGLNDTGDIEIHFSPLISIENPAIFKANI